MKRRPTSAGPGASTTPARPAAATDPGLPCLQAQAGGVLLLLKVQPRASRDEFGELMGSELKLKVTAPPVDSAANESVVEFVAAAFGVPRGAVRLVRGQTARHKQLLIAGLDLGEADRRLRRALEA